MMDKIKYTFRNSYVDPIFLKELAYVGDQKQILNLHDDRVLYKGEDSKDHYVDSDGYLITEVMSEPKMVDGPYFTYRINSDGFRSNHFNKIDKDNINILYGGCSWTFGEGLPEEFSWVRLLTDKIKTIYPNKKVEYHNTGFMGSSIHLIVKNILTFIREYGKPDYIFIVIPDTHREIFYALDRQEFNKFQAVGDLLKRAASRDVIRYMDWYQEEFNILNAIDMLKMLEMYCEEAGLNLLWTTWCEHEKEIYTTCNFKNFIVPEPGLYYKNRFDNYTHLEKSNPSVFYMPENIDNLPYWEVARDGSHPGTRWTTYISDVFFKELYKRGIV